MISWQGKKANQGLEFESKSHICYPKRSCEILYARCLNALTLCVRHKAIALYIMFIIVRKLSRIKFALSIRKRANPLDLYHHWSET